MTKKLSPNIFTFLDGSSRQVLIQHLHILKGEGGKECELCLDGRNQVWLSIKTFSLKICCLIVSPYGLFCCTNYNLLNSNNNIVNTGQKVSSLACWKCTSYRRERRRSGIDSVRPTKKSSADGNFFFTMNIRSQRLPVKKARHMLLCGHANAHTKQMRTGSGRVL